MRAGMRWWLRDRLNRVGRDRRLMDYAKSGDPGIGVVIEHREWVEGMEIGYQRSDIAAGMGSNKTSKIINNFFLIFLYFYWHLLTSHHIFIQLSTMRRFTHLILSQDRCLTNSWAGTDNLVTWCTQALKGWVRWYMWVKHPHVSLSPQSLKATKEFNFKFIQDFLLWIKVNWPITLHFDPRV